MRELEQEIERLRAAWGHRPRRNAAGRQEDSLPEPNFPKTCFDSGVWIKTL